MNKEKTKTTTIFVVNEVDNLPVVQSFEFSETPDGKSLARLDQINFWGIQKNVLVKADGGIFYDPSLALTHFIAMKAMEYAECMMDAEDALEMAEEAERMLKEDYG